MTADAPTVAAIGMVLGSVGAGWWFKRWADSVDRKFEKLTAELHALALAQAQKQGAFEHSVSGLQSVTKTLGRHQGSLERLWAVIEARFPDVSRRGSGKES